MKRIRRISAVLALTMVLPLGLSACAVATQPAVAESSVDKTDTHVSGESDFPVRFDLREYGVVTPVKYQNPWGSCWSFGGIAAAETSILTTLGMTCEEYKTETGKDFDLSEKHLIWFASRPINAQTNESQVGEGIYFTNNEANSTAAYSTGGQGMFITTLFAAGVGPIYEEYCPYQGAEGLTSAEFKEKYPDKVKIAAIEQTENELGLTDKGLTLKQFYDKREEMSELLDTMLNSLHTKGFLDESVTADNISYETLEDACVRLINRASDKAIEEGSLCYAAGDDWTLPDTAEDGSSNRDIYSGFTLVDGNILPPLSVKKDGQWAGINEVGMRALKSELLKGHAATINFYADQSKPGDEARKDGYMNVDTWAQYTDEEKETNHVVCIVGWDDTYSRENFNEGHLPEGDGAWIVKNSWGSETEYATRDDGTPIGKAAWGIRDEEGKATGYFYLSYYDKNITTPETMTFDTDLLQDDGLMSVWAYDYMPALFTDDGSIYKVQDENVLKTANVFTNTMDREVTVNAISTKTASPRARVEYSLYRLNEDAQNPEDGEYLGKRLAYYDYVGFHRESLLRGDIKLKPGERIAVVVTETVTDHDGVKQYEFAANQTQSKKLAEKVGAPMYGVGIVNKGESFVYENGQWTDWFDYEKKPSDSMVAQLAAMGVEAEDDLVSTDNFSIKLYVCAEQ